ncbi:MAG TPA: hypothetical protein VIQ51_14900 [Chryseosolibacter sp.]
MSTGPTFEAYLTSKKINSEAFQKSEPEEWKAWKVEFEQIHPNSFTVQKLNLINLIRRRYRLDAVVEEKKSEGTPVVQKPGPPRPIKPVIKPKLN